MNGDRPINAPAKLAAFAAGLAVLFGGGALAGGAIDPDVNSSVPHGEERAAGHGEAGGGHGSEPAGGSGAHPVRGLSVADGGLRVVTDDTDLRRGKTERLSFRIVDEGGDTVRDFDVEHEKRMHLIVARRDLTGFQHLHPKQAGDGSWTTAVRLDEAGSYRMFADFSHEDEPRTLATDLRVDGRADLRALPAPRPSATTDDGYRVSLDQHEPGTLEFSVTKHGAPVQTEQYLGAGGHLVALREGDLAFLHVHPVEHGGGEGIAFEATFPTPGRYRLFLQFKHDGAVHTAAFTQEVR
jgi:hypothetical protein